MHNNEHKPGTPAPLSGRYEELNVLGSPTGRMIEVAQGDRLPTLPRGWTWRTVGRPTIPTMTVAELRERAAHYRQMATTATTVEVRDALLRLAQRLMDTAEVRDAK